MQTTEITSAQLAEWNPEFPGVKAFRSGIEFSEPMDFNYWKHCGRALCKTAQSLPWWIGDWLAFGRKLFCNRDQATGEFVSGEGTTRYEAAMEITKIEGATLANYSYVSQNIPISIRREPGILSWSHHREVAPLKPKEIAYWLDRAVAKDWSVSELRQAIRRANATESPDINTPKTDAAAMTLLRVSTDFHRCLTRLEAEVVTWTPARRMLMKQDLANHISEAQSFYNRL